MASQCPTPAPGWYPDPEGQPGQRYHDGRRWTQHFVPTPPTIPVAPAQPAVAVAVATGGGTNHALHLILTLLTCGAWLPIWILVALFGGGSSSSVAVAGPGAVAVPANRRPALVVVAVLGGLFALGVIAEHPWLIAVLAVVGALAAVGVWVTKSAQQREEQLRAEQFQRDMLADRADYEDQLYREGDPRGVHGRYPPPE